MKMPIGGMELWDLAVYRTTCASMMTFWFYFMYYVQNNHSLRSSEDLALFMYALSLVNYSLAYLYPVKCSF
jgi:hypothetical protein